MESYVLAARDPLFEQGTKEELIRRNEDGIEGLQTCETAACMPMTISTPISLRPIIRKLPVTVSVCEEPVLEQTPCGRYILTQELCVRVPIEISVESTIESPPPCCGCMSDTMMDEESYWGRY